MVSESDLGAGHQCWLCAEPAETPCEDCDRVHFCGPGHRDLHRQRGGTCRPFTVRRSDSVGRFMVATRDIEPLEIILEERPLVMGPCRDGNLVCVECLVSVPSEFTDAMCILTRRWHCRTQTAVSGVRGVDCRCVVSALASRGHSTASSVTSSRGQDQGSRGTGTRCHRCWRGSPRPG